MSRLLYTIENVVDEIRSQLDEQNNDSVDTVRDILPTLNRAQDFAFDTLTRKYPEPILKYTFLQLLSNVAEYDIPEDVFEDRIQKIEMKIPSGNDSNGGATYREVQRVSYRDISNYESASRTNVPYYYTIVGRKIRFVPTPTGTYGCRVWYLRDPEKLTLPQGRITVLNTTSNYVVVDGVGDSLTTESDKLGSYVNIIDGQTGEIRGSLQIQSIATDKITFRSVPTRSVVLNRTISGSMADFSGIGLDDYLSPIDGTCVPYFGRPTCNFLIQYTVAEIVRKLGGTAETEENILKKFEQQLERTWAGREQTLRVKKRSQNWGVPTRRWYYE